MRKLLLLLLALITVAAGCSGRSDTVSAAPTSSPGGSGRAEISFVFNRRGGIASNQFAVWVEDSAGEFVKTLYATRFTAESGWEYRSDALPVWVERSGLGAGTGPDADAYTGATPKSGTQTYIWDCTDESGRPVPEGDYHFLVEGTIFWQDAVLFEGVLSVGGGKNTAQFKAEFTTEEAEKSDMITDVAAVYTP